MNMFLSKVERCRNVIAAVDNLSLTQKEEIFKIIVSKSCDYTVNKNGVFLNLTWLSTEVLKDIEQFITFCQASQERLDHCERMQLSMSETMNGGGLDDDALELATAASSHAPSVCDASDVADPSSVDYEALTEAAETSLAALVSGPKVSSTLRFYLLKKRFAKMAPLTGPMPGDLVKDTPCMVAVSG